MFSTPRQLTAADFIFPRHLTTEGHFRLLHVFLSQTKCINNKFQIYRDPLVKSYSLYLKITISLTNFLYLKITIILEYQYIYYYLSTIIPLFIEFIKLSYLTDYN